MRFTAGELAAALGGVLHGPDVEVSGLAIDSRLVVPGQMFAAVKGERDGHDFVGAARGSGASVVLVERVDGEVGTAILVPDVHAALADLARVARERIEHSPTGAGRRVVGVTGSVGKTTTKDLLASVLGGTFVTAASERSFNNELGVPLTLANAPDDVEALVVEKGSRGAGHIRLLCGMARPTVGVVTTVEAVHTEVMGGIEEIAAAKGELIEALPSQGLAVLNADVPLVAAMAVRSAAPIVTFGAAGDVRAVNVELDGELRASFTLESPWGSVKVALGVRGEHNVTNALAAAAVGLALDVELEQVAERLSEPDLSPMRMDLRRAPSGAVVLDDSYNAGPASMAAALRALAALPARRRVAVVGVMAELGERAVQEHASIAELAGALGIELIAVGTDLYGADSVATPLDAVRALGEPGEGVAVLVKGSRVAGLEVVADALLD